VWVCKKNVGGGKGRGGRKVGGGGGGGAWRLDNRDHLTIIISLVTLRSHNRNPEYCLLSGERYPVPRNIPQILVFCTLWGPPRPGVLRGLTFATALTA